MSLQNNLMKLEKGFSKTLSSSKMEILIEEVKKHLALKFNKILLNDDCIILYLEFLTIDKRFQKENFNWEDVLLKNVVDLEYVNFLILNQVPTDQILEINGITLSELELIKRNKSFEEVNSARQQRLNNIKPTGSYKICSKYSESVKRMLSGFHGNSDAFSYLSKDIRKWESILTNEVVDKLIKDNNLDKQYEVFEILYLDFDLPALYCYKTLNDYEMSLCSTQDVFAIQKNQDGDLVLSKHALVICDITGAKLTKIPNSWEWCVELDVSNKMLIVILMNDVSDEYKNEFEKQKKLFGFNLGFNMMKNKFVKETVYVKEFSLNYGRLIGRFFAVNQKDLYNTENNLVLTRNDYFNELEKLYVNNNYYTLKIIDYSFNAFGETPYITCVISDELEQALQTNPSIQKLVDQSEKMFLEDNKLVVKTPEIIEKLSQPIISCCWDKKIYEEQIRQKTALNLIFTDNDELTFCFVKNFN